MIVVLPAILIDAVHHVAMTEEIFLESHSPVSKRYAVLEDNGQIAFLYLTEPGRPRPMKDAVVYMRIPPDGEVDWESIKKTGATPLLRKDLASPTAVIKNPKASEFKFKWSIDGESVAVLRNGEALAFATVKERFGYSRAVSVSSPLGNAWDQARYIGLFSQ
jgi:hypothetical protein